MSRFRISSFSIFTHPGSSVLHGAGAIAAERAERKNSSVPIETSSGPAWNWLLRVLGAYLILPNLVVGLIVLLTAGDWHPIDLDYLLVATVVGLAAPAMVVAAFTLLFLLDLGLALAPVFHFDGATFSQGLGQLLLARPWLSTAIALPVAAASLGFGYALLRASSSRRSVTLQDRSLVFATAIIIAALDAANGSNQLLHADGTRLSINLAGSGMYHIAVEMRDAHREVAQRMQFGAALPTARGATSQLIDDLASSAFASGDVQNVAVVVVESMGLPRDQDVRALLLSPLTQGEIASRYEVRTGEARFSGPTTAGEFRELCGVVGTYLVAPQTPLNRCIPELLRARGFHTIALHGFRAGFFNRASWYPVIGFEQMLFESNAAAPGASRCGAIFRGPCDADVGRQFGLELLNAPTSDRRFVYWLTLSSHFPIDHNAAEESALDCAQLTEPYRDRTVCDLARTWSTVLHVVRSTALDPRIRPTRFIIVGDHSPPFLDARRRELFSSSSVPFVELIPRTPDNRKANPAVTSLPARSID